MKESKKLKLNYTQKLDRSESEEVISTLEKNDELNRKHLQTKKNKEIYPANIRLDEDVLKTFFVFIFRRGLQDVFKTF